MTSPNRTSREDSVTEYLIKTNAMQDEESLRKDDGIYTLNELKEQLPKSLYRKVAEHLADPGTGEVGQSDVDVGKSVRENGLDYFYERLEG